jgi:PAS domain S-box-containing protein
MEETAPMSLLQIAFDAADQSIAVLQPIYNDQGKAADGTILLLNARAREQAGAIAYEGRRYADIFPFTKETGIPALLQEVTATGTPARFERMYHHDGKDHWYRFSVVKQEALLVLTWEDVSECRQAEMTLRKTLEETTKQRDLYDSIANNIQDLVYAFDLEYRFTYANDALLTMWGKTAEDAIGKGLRENGYEEWHALMHEREIDLVAATKKAIRGTVSFPHAVLGSRIYDYILSPVFNEAGTVEFIAGSTRDITDLRSVIDQTPAATLVLGGDDLVIEQINNAMLQLIGQGAEILGKPLIEVLPELEGQYVWEQVQKVYREGVPFDQTEVLVPHTRNGIMQDHYYNLAYRPRKQHGQITGMIQVAIDITEQVLARKRLEESERRFRILNETLELQVNERTRELQRSNEDLQQFAHVASHDLKEPVRKIKTFTNRLEQNLAGKLNTEESRFIERINIATNRIFSMIDGVLTYSTTNAGMQNCEKVDLNGLIGDIETDLEITIQATGASIAHNTLPVLEGAPILLYQLFYNLVNNAIKFVAPGTAPHISITAETPAPGQEGFSRIVLQDNGIGFEDAYAERIFETFTRLNSKDAYEGTGLGLALCKKIVERHGGSIHAAGNPGKGAIFTILLPLQQKQAGI